MSSTDVQKWGPVHPPAWSAGLMFLALVLATLVLGLRESWEAHREAPVPQHSQRGVGGGVADRHA